MPHIETTDLSFIADRVQPQTWTLFQVLRTRMRQMKGVTMKVQYEKHTREPIPAFFYCSRQLFHVHARGEEISATLHADQKARTKIAEDQSIDWRARDQVKKRTWAAFTLRSSKDLVPFMELVRAKYDMINQEASACSHQIQSYEVGDAGPIGRKTVSSTISSAKPGIRILWSDRSGRAPNPKRSVFSPSSEP